MSWLTDKHLTILAVFLYGISTLYSVFLWRKGFRNDDRINYLLLLGAFAFHFAGMLKRGLSLQHCPVSNLYESMLFVGWTIVAAYLVIGLMPRLRFIGAFAAPLLFGIGVFALTALYSHGDAPDFKNSLVNIHAGLILLSYGAFGLSATAGLMYITQERDLKLHRMRAVFSLMPSMERLERIMSRLVTGGFLLFTIGLSLSPLLMKQAAKVSNGPDPKIIWSVFVWLLYLTVILWHGRFSQTGRRFALSTIGSFVFVLLTFWGVNLLSPSHHP